MTAAVPGFKKKNIAPQPTLGALLKSARKKKQRDLETAEQETKIRQRYLEAIEEDRFDMLPLSHYKGFVRRYGEYLGLASAVIEQELSRVPTVSDKKQVFFPYQLKQERSWYVTPKVIATASLIIVLLGFIGYVTYQVRQFAAPPLLEITKPDGEGVTTAEVFILEGNTDPGSIVYVDDLQAATDANGHFSFPLTLRPGLNQVTVRAENRIKKQSMRAVPILYQAPLPTPTPIPTSTPTPVPSPTATAQTN